MNDARTYGNLREAFGDKIEDFTILEHGKGRGNGTAVLDPDIGGYSNNSMETVSDLAVETVEAVYESVQGVAQYDVEGADDLTADEAVKTIIGETTSDSPPEDLMPATV